MYTKKRKFMVSFSFRWNTVNFDRATKNVESLNYFDIIVYAYLRRFLETAVYIIYLG